jgi:hypothetical protein
MASSTCICYSHFCYVKVFGSFLRIILRRSAVQAEVAKNPTMTNSKILMSLWVCLQFILGAGALILAAIFVVTSFTDLGGGPQRSQSSQQVGTLTSLSIKAICSWRSQWRSSCPLSCGLSIVMKHCITVLPAFLNGLKVGQSQGNPLSSPVSGGLPVVNNCPIQPTAHLNYMRCEHVKGYEQGLCL